MSFARYCSKMKDLVVSPKSGILVLKRGIAVRRTDNDFLYATLVEGINITLCQGFEQVVVTCLANALAAAVSLAPRMPKLAPVFWSISDVARAMLLSLGS